ncbi:hypothetical protein ACC708_29395, partial [Rhizobium ruizarguesonis]
LPFFIHGSRSQIRRQRAMWEWNSGYDKEAGVTDHFIDQDELRRLVRRSTSPLPVLQSRARTTRSS